MIHVDRVIVVEGKYDRIALARVTDALVLETGGFGIFTDDAKLESLRTLARKKGLIVLTDSDRSGVSIRNALIGAIGSEYIRNAYIPDCYGTEKRKKHPSAEGKLGVEGMSEEVLASILSVAQVPREDVVDPITNADLYNAGLLGGRDSAALRAEYQIALGLPSRMSPRKFLEIVNALRRREELRRDMAERKM